jgi:hypothetical protein
MEMWYFVGGKNGLLKYDIDFNIASNDRMTANDVVGYMSGNCRGLFEVTVPAFVWRFKRKSTKSLSELRTGPGICNSSYIVLTRDRLGL